MAGGNSKCPALNLAAAPSKKTKPNSTTHTHVQDAVQLITLTYIADVAHLLNSQLYPGAPPPGNHFSLFSQLRQAINNFTACSTLQTCPHHTLDNDANDAFPTNLDHSQSPSPADESGCFICYLSYNDFQQNNTPMVQLNGCTHQFCAICIQRNNDVNCKNSCQPKVP